MKKHILTGVTLLIAAAFTSCTEDFKDWLAPQTNSPENAITIPGFSASAVAAQNLDTDAETVPLFALNAASLPDGFQLGNARIELTVPGQSEEEATSTIINTDISGQAPVETLQDLVVEAYGKRPTERTFQGHVLVNAIKDDQAVYIDAGNIEVNLIPKAPYIAQNYYIVGGTKDWNDSKEQKFSHSDLDVYDDPIFTIVIDGNPDGDTWFAIGDDAGVEAIGEGVWNQLLGIVGGDNKAESGSLDYRYNMGADNSFCVSNAKKIKVTINMMEYTFQVSKVNIADAYYLIGGPGDWNADAAWKMQMSHSDKDVFDDPVFTYTFESTGSGMWFAFGDADAINAVAAGDWTQLYGYVGEEALSGNFDRRYNIGADNSFHVDGAAKMYRFSVNMAEMTYEIKPLNFSEYIWEAGVNNDWGAVEQALYCANQDGIYTGFFYAQDADWSGGKGAFKFTGAFNNWDNGNYGTGTMSADGLSGTLIDDGGSGNVLVDPGFYRADVNLAEMTYTLTPIKSVYVVGSAVNNDWDTGVQMTYNVAERCWECTTTLNEGQIKFKGNGTWDNLDGNWGGTLDNIINGSNDNVDVPVTGNVTIKLFVSCDTKSYATVTAAN